MFMATDIRKGSLEFMKVEQCPIVGDYLISPMINLELPPEVEKQGELLKFIPIDQCPSNETYVFRPLVRRAS